MADESWIWVFNGAKSAFPSGVFTSRELAEEWIQRNGLVGTLTAYPLDVGVYDWAVERGSFKPKREEQKSALFIGNFSSASQEHYHYSSREDASEESGDDLE